MKIPMMCLPGGASDGSYIVGMVSSSSGDCEGCPYLASSQARSTYSVDGQMCMVARCCGPSPGKARKFGKPSSPKVIVHDGRSQRYLRTLAATCGGSAAARDNRKKS